MAFEIYFLNLKVFLSYPSQFVRKLFPSLSNASTVGVVSPKNNGMPTVHQGTVLVPLQLANNQDGAKLY